MGIKEIRQMTGMTQKDFGEYYNIPLNTIKKWETIPSSNNHRECPVYVKQLLENAVRDRYRQNKDIKVFIEGNKYYSVSNPGDDPIFLCEANDLNFYWVEELAKWKTEEIQRKDIYDKWAI